MKVDSLAKKKHTERITEWISGGAFAVAVEVEATFLPDRPTEPYLTPETVRFLEKVEALATAGDVEALKKVGKVYVQHDQAARMTSAASQKTDGKTAG
jgi:hypothetical protein